MVEFGNLSYDEQVARLTELAHVVLEAYGLSSEDYGLSCVSHWQNSTFRVDVLRGELAGRYALRINRPVSQNVATIRSELQWLDALNRDTKLHVPKPIKQRNGDLLTSIYTRQVEETRHCVLFKWIEGEFLDGELTPRHMILVGEFMAKLHNHSASFESPAGFIRNNLEWAGQMRTFYEEKELDSSPAISKDTWTLFHQVRTRVEPRMCALGNESSTFGLIHNDIYQKNMLFHQGQVRVLDFDNCGWAHYLLDIAVTLAQVRKHPDYLAKRNALLTGYRNYRMFSDDEEQLLDEFIAARIMLLALYMASQIENEQMKAKAPAYVVTVAEDLRRWMAGGRIYG
ncbi:MAG: phosphotransferase [Aggregatilineales bacterium]